MKSQQGQIALIALLVLAVATTVGMALISRGTTNVSITRNVEESARAFSAAEVGIDEAIKSGTEGTAIINYSSGIDTTIPTSYQTTIATISASANVPFTFPTKTIKGETSTLWLVPHNADGTILETPTYTANSIDVCWDTNNPMPALVVTVLYKESSDGSYRAVKGAFDPDTARNDVNKFSDVTATTGGCGEGTNTTYKETVTFNSLSSDINPAVDTLIMLRMRPVYEDAQIVIVPSQALPDQFTRIESVGQTGSGTTRKIVVTRQFAAPSSIFDHAVYSQGSFVQQ